MLSGALGGIATTLLASGWRGQAALVDPLCGFGPNGSLTILVGQKVPHKRPYTPPEPERAVWNNMRKQNAETARKAISAVNRGVLAYQTGL